MNIKDTTVSNWLIEFDDGTTDVVPKSKQNTLLIEHNLWGLLQEGTEVMTIDGTDDHPSITLVPSDDAKEFTLRVGDYEALHLGAHHKSRLVNALADGKAEDDVAARLLDLFDDLRNSQVRSRVVTALAERPPFSEHVEDTPGGWLVHDHLLLTWEREFYHPKTTSRNRSGGIVDSGSSERAYNVNVSLADGHQRQVTLDGTDFRLTDAEMAFVAKALWAITHAPGDV